VSGGNGRFCRLKVESREKAVSNDQVIKLCRGVPFDKFQLGVRQLIETLIIQRMADNDKIVTR